MENFNATEYIEALSNFAFSASLDRMKEVTAKLNNPQKKIKAIHVAGTNGKGSVVTAVAKALEHSGKKVGKYISPHITDFRERIQINGENISLEDLNSFALRVKNTNIPLNKFEFITAVALLYFADSNVDVAVMETGLGGRLDATNILENKLVSVITKIGLDHTEILGNTLSQIATEKCGIINGTKVVTCINQEKDALDVIKNFSKEVNIPSNKDLRVISSDISGNSFIYKGEAYKTKMAGAFQIENAVTAIETLLNCGIDLTAEDIKFGINNAFIPARLQILSRNPLTVLDGAHNPAGARVLSEFLKNYKNTLAVIGVMKDKDFEEILKITLPFVKKVICVTPNGDKRSLKAEILGEYAKKYCADVTVYEDLPAVLNEIKSQNRPTFIYGSLYLASNVLKLFD